MTKRVAIYPGTFDPLTLGHVDLIERAAKIFDEVLVAVAVSQRKQPMFDIKKRLQFCVESLVAVKGVRVALLDGLLVDFAKVHQAQFIIRGVRSGDDVGYEMANANMNQKLSKGKLETVFLPTSSQFSYISATMVREIIALKGDVAEFVPKQVAENLGR